MSSDESKQRIMGNGVQSEWQMYEMEYPLWALQLKTVTDKWFKLRCID